MAHATQTPRPRLFIATRRSAPTESAPKRPWLPHLVNCILVVLTLLMLLHFFSVAHTTDPKPSAPMDCTSFLHSLDYTQIVRLQSATQSMPAVQFVDTLTAGQPAALVQVTTAVQGQSDPTLDIYIYGCTMQQHAPQRTTLFAQRDLLQGTVSLSTNNTMITSQLDPAFAGQAGISVQPIQQMIYREYAWHNGAFAQLLYPSLYPVSSRSEAELLQQEADNGQVLPWIDPLTTAEQMASDLLKWPLPTSTAPSSKTHAPAPANTLVSETASDAQVLLTNKQQHLSVIVTLKRLVRADKKGLWFVVEAQTAGITLNHTLLPIPAPSPITIQGTGALPDGIGTALLFDHTKSPIDTLNDATLTVHADGSYTTSIFYDKNLLNQQGVLLVQSLPSSRDKGAGELLLVNIIIGH